MSKVDKDIVEYLEAHGSCESWRVFDSMQRKGHCDDACMKRIDFGGDGFVRIYNMLVLDDPVSLYRDAETRRDDASTEMQDLWNDMAEEQRESIDE